MNQEVSVPISTNIAQMMSGMPHEEIRLVAEKIHHYIEQYKKLSQQDGLATAFAFHKAIDVELNTSETKANPYFKRIACKKGCGFCCYVNVDINEDEAELIIQYCKEKNIPIDIERLKKQQHKTDKTYNELTTAEKKCNFLSDEMTCKIYEHRPAACRKFFALDTNKICESDSSEPHAIYGNIMLEILQVAIYQGARTDSMAKLLIEKLI